MNATFLSEPASRLYTWIARTRAETRACRALAHVDTRTLRDIGFTPRHIAVLKVMCSSR